jgi:TrmH family RNA methyltransferase
MKNCGLSRLAIVDPDSALASHKDDIIARAVHAGEVWHNAAVYAGLREAVAGCALVIGTSRRRGALRKSITMTPHETAVHVKHVLEQRLPDTIDSSGHSAAPIAIVFGNERTGLETAELRLCNLASYIPASGDFPSYNLSHAAQIYCYELFCAMGQSEYASLVDTPKSAALCNFSAMPNEAWPSALSSDAEGENRLAGGGGQWVPIDAAAIDGFVSAIIGALERLGFYKKPGRDRQAELFRDMFARAGLTQSEADYLRNIFFKAARIGGRSGDRIGHQPPCAPASAPPAFAFKPKE